MDKPPFLWGKCVEMDRRVESGEFIAQTKHNHNPCLCPNCDEHYLNRYYLCTMANVYMLPDGIHEAQISFA